MLSILNHIRKISVQVKIHEVENAFSFQQKLAEYIKSEFPKKLEKLLDEYNTDDYIFIDKLVVNCKLKNIDNLDDLWLAVQPVIKSEIEKRNRTKELKPLRIENWLEHIDGRFNKDIFQTSRDQLLIAFLHFLQKGYFLWWLHQTEASYLKKLVLKSIKDNRRDFFELITKSGNNEKVLGRLISFFTAGEEDEVLGFLRDDLPDIFDKMNKELLDDIELDNQQIQKEFIQNKKELTEIIILIDKSKELIKSGWRLLKWEALLQISYPDLKGFSELNLSKKLSLSVKEQIEKKQSPTFLLKSDTERTGNVDVPEKDQDRVRDQIDKKTSKPFTEEEFTYINNAGLILVHPFIKHLFSHLELLNKAGNIKEDKISEAVHILHYLSNRDEEFFESNAILEKILCGLNVDEVIQNNIILPDTVKEECENMLKAVIEHWSALKSTTPDGLRSGFLNRSGKLSWKEENWFLQVEQKTMDVLLEKLLWTISMIRLPWMQNWLKVEWI